MISAIGKAILGAVAVSTLVAPASSAVTVTATVPNNYVRTCSYYTGHCTGYVQVNGPHDYNVPNVYSTQWRWVWIW